MTEPTAELLQHWHEFYLLVGTAAAALVALADLPDRICYGIIPFFAHAAGLVAAYLLSAARSMRRNSRRHRCAAADR